MENGDKCQGTSVQEYKTHTLWAWTIIAEADNNKEDGIEIQSHCWGQSST